MLTRANDLDLTCDDPGVATALDAVEAALLRYGKDVADYLTAPAATAPCAYALATHAAIHLLALTASGRAKARPLIAAAERLAPAATPHEQMFVAAASAWLRGNLKGAIARYRVIAERWPRDLLAAKLCHFHQINTGDFTGMLAALEPVVAAQPDNHFVHGMQAFALEQCGEADAAERAGRHAATLGSDPWAHHAVAHVLDTAGRAREGRDWLAGKAHEWDGCSSFMLTHNWWHAALFEITLGDHDAALALYDTRVWGVRRDSVQDQVNAVSLLARLELHGVAVGDRWADLAPHLAQRIDDRANPFVDLHTVYGLARSGADLPLAMLIGGLASGDPAVATAADGLASHARRRYARAAAALTEVREVAIGFGGSHTQRQLLDLIAADAAAKAADWGRVIAGPWHASTMLEELDLACAV